jgi:APA family basic amino acid/polyamine antiporter
LVLLSALDATGSAFTFAILLSTAMSLVMYLICSLGALRLMYTEAIPRRASLFATSVLGTLFSVWAFWGSGLQALGWGAVLLAAGYPLYRLTLRERARLAPAAE